VTSDLSATLLRRLPHLNADNDSPPQISTPTTFERKTIQRQEGKFLHPLVDRIRSLLNSKKGERRQRSSRTCGMGVEFVWPDTPIRRSARLVESSPSSDASFMQHIQGPKEHEHVQQSPQEHLYLQESDPPSPALTPPRTYHNLPVENVDIPTVDLPPVASTDNWLSVSIGKADPTFMNYDEYNDSGRPSLCDARYESESEDEENSFFDANENLEDLVWPAELLYNP
jgi:hypothetical protein